MDVNVILLWLVIPSTLILLYKAIQQRPRDLAWLSKGAVVLAVAGAAYRFWPDISGYISVAVWALLLAAPAVILRRVLRASHAQRYDRAAFWARVLRFLHPSRRLGLQIQTIDSLRMADDGDLEKAIQRLESLTQIPGETAFMARLHILRLRNEWARIIDLLQPQYIIGPISSRVVLLPGYLRALGETGDIASVVREYAQHEPYMRAAPVAVARWMSRLTLFVYTGKPDAVQSVFDGPGRDISPAARRGSVLFARQAAGQDVTGELTELTHSTQSSVARSALWRLEHPLPVARAILTPWDQEMLDRWVREQAHETRYLAPAAGRFRAALATWCIAMANIAMFLVQLANGGAESEQALLRLGALATDLPLSQNWWRLLAANFLHAGWLHLSMNMLGLAVLGPFAERMLGKWRFIVLYLCSGILAMLGVVGLTRVGFLPPMSLVGASGAIMGLVGATAAVLIVDRLRGASQLAGYRLRGIILIVVIQVIFDSMTPQVSGSAHLLGAAAGLVLGLILYPSRSQPSLAATPAAPVFSLSPEGRGSG